MNGIVHELTYVNTAQPDRTSQTRLHNQTGLQKGRIVIL